MGLTGKKAFGNLGGDRRTFFGGQFGPLFAESGPRPCPGNFGKATRTSLGLNNSRRHMGAFRSPSPKTRPRRGYAYFGFV